MSQHIRSSYAGEANSTVPGPTGRRRRSVKVGGSRRSPWAASSQRPREASALRPSGMQFAVDTQFSRRHRWGRQMSSKNPAAVVQRQPDACNGRDMYAWLAKCTHDVQHLELLGPLLLAGHEDASSDVGQLCGTRRASPCCANASCWDTSSWLVNRLRRRSSRGVARWACHACATALAASSGRRRLLGASMVPGAPAVP